MLLQRLGFESSKIVPSMSKHISSRYVSGPSGEVGYIAKSAGYGINLRSFLDERSLRAQEEMKNQAERERTKLDVYVKNFWVNSDKRYVNSKINRFVDLGMQAHSNDLEHKKDKLKVMMLDEQSDLTQEYIDKAQKRSDLLSEMKTRKAEEIQSKATVAQKHFAEKAYERIFKQNCDELRTKTQRENRIALNAMHKRQMNEKKLAEEVEKEEEKIWAILVDADDAKMTNRADYETSATAKRTDDYIASLKEQIKSVEFQKQNQNCIERLEELWRQDIQKAKDNDILINDEETKRQRDIQQMELDRQLELNRIIKDRQKCEDDLINKMMIDEDGKAAEREKAEIVDCRAQLRSELAIFRESLKQYNESLDTHEKEMEAFSEQLHREHEMKKLASKHRSAQARKNLLASCIDVRKQQIAEKKVQLDSDKDSALAQADLIRFRQAQSVALDACKKQQVMTLREEERKMSGESEKYASLVREREKLIMDEFLNKRQREYEAIDRKTIELLSQPLQLTTGTATHPFVGTLMSNGVEREK